nr:hypothetical protein [Lachnospiraceae bacterium]
MEKIKKLFGGIDLTWKKLIIWAVLAGVYTAVMAMLPFTKETSFRDIAVMFEWWILFGIIIIANSKSAEDSALKCFVFFLISQPLVYLLQVPFSYMGWKLFGYYRYWFMWTLLCLPMGFIGYYIKKKNYLSMIILFPMLFALASLGMGYFNSAIESFPNHLLSAIACFAMIIVIVLGIFDDKKIKIITFSIVTAGIIVVAVLNGGLVNQEFETVKSIKGYDVSLEGDVFVSYYSGTKKGKVEVIPFEESYNLKLTGSK